MKLTVEQHPEAIKRYGHVKPARGRKTRACYTRLPGSERVCTREKGHRGPHVAHGSFRRVEAVWDSAARVPEKRSSTSGPKSDGSKKPAPRRPPVHLRAKTPDGPLEALRKRIVHLVSSPEDLAFLVFFLAFVGFAVHWFLVILF